MDFISYALAKKALDATTEGLKISNIEIIDGELIITPSVGNPINAGKIPSSSLEEYEELKEQLKELEDSIVKTNNGILTNATITLAEDPKEDMDAATKKYVDSKNLKIIKIKNREDFPTSGLSNVLYKAEDEGKTYIWTVSGYEVLCETQSAEIENIKIINGGNSNGR